MVGAKKEEFATGNASNGHLVYARRKSEGDGINNSSFGSTNIKTEHEGETQMDAPSISCFQDLTSLQSALPCQSDRLDWEGPYQLLQMLLKKVDESDQTDYVQMLQSFSSDELSRQAVELEKRSIRLSLDEAKEMQRVAELNVLGRPLNSFISFLTHKEHSTVLNQSDQPGKKT